MKRLLYALFIAGVLVSIVSSCKKPKNTTTPPPPPGALVVYSNVHIVDSTQWILHGGTGDGFYNFSFTPSTPNVNVNPGDIIVGVTNGGYIRRVSNVTINGAFLVLGTTQATMADVFKSGSFNLQVPINDAGQSGVSRSYTNFGVCNGDGYYVFASGNFNIQPVINLAFAFDSTGLTNFQMSTTNTALSDSFVVTANGPEPYNWTKDSTLPLVNINNIQWVTAYGNISVPIVMNFGLSFAINGIGGSPGYGSISSRSRVTWVSNSTFSGGLQYSSNHWQPVYGSNTTNTLSLADTAYNASMNTNVSFLGQITSNFYSTPGPKISFGMTGNLYGTDRYAPGFSSSTKLWTVQNDAELTGNVYSSLVPTMPAFNQSWTSDTISYQTPYELFLVSGNGQTGNIAMSLPNPLVVQVNDSRGNPVSGVTVHFTTSGAASGYFGNQIGGPSSEILVTDQTGSAQIIWTLGGQQGSNAQSVIAWAQDGNEVNFSGSPVTFTATGH